MKHSLRATIFCALVGLPAVAHAQDDSPSADAIKRASDAFSLGKLAYREEEFVEAAEQFEAADDHAPSVNALRAAMTSRRKADQLDRAATLAALALTRHPEDPKLAEEAQAILEEASAYLHRVQVSCDIPCSLVVGTSLVHGRAALEQTVYLVPGQHEIRASWSEAYGSETQSIVAIAEGRDEIAFTRPDPIAETGAGRQPGTDEFGMEIEEETPAGDGDDRRHGPPPGVFIGGAVATVVLGGVSIWSGIDTLNNPGRDAVEEKCDSTDCDLYRRGQSNELRTNVLFGVTAGLGVATIIIGAVTDWHGKDSRRVGRTARVSSNPRVRPWVEVADGAMLGARGRF
ncbi:MAG: hypothetical protein JW751_32150 [Polyangiaceae bacterium]|nr:hypothetical protein [Polyangiaceae bacterium]